MITGKVKFLERSFALPNAGASASTSDGTNATYLLSEAPDQWQSLASASEISINFPTKTVDRIIIRNHNLLNFEISSAPFKNITNIRNERIETIAEQNLRDKTSYYAFDPIDIDSLIIKNTGGAQGNALRTFIQQIIVTQELGTLSGYPELGAFAFSSNEVKYKVKGGSSHITKQRRTLDRWSVSFKNYINSDDIALARTIHERDFPTLVWACGGNEDQFRYPYEGVRLEDFYALQTTGNFGVKQDKGSYQGVMRATLNFTESV